jgi:hypothetical protein
MRRHGATVLPCSPVDGCIRPGASATAIPGLNRCRVLNRCLRDGLVVQLFLVWSPTIKLASIENGLAVVPLETEELKRELDPHPNTEAYVLVVQIGDIRRTGRPGKPD